MWGVRFLDIPSPPSRPSQPRGGSRVPSPSRVTRPRTTAWLLFLFSGTDGMDWGWPRRACSPDAPMAKPSSRTAWPREEARGSGPSLHFGQAQDCRGSVVNATGVFKRLSNPAAQHIRLVPGLPARRSPALIPPTTQETVNFLWRAGLRRHRFGEITVVAAGGNFVSWCP
jgi:hypothetical protein